MSLLNNNLSLTTLTSSNSSSSTFDYYPLSVLLDWDDRDQMGANTSSIKFSVFLLEGVKKYILEGCLLVSAVLLVASFLVYCIVPELRTVPGKCLMGLIVSEFITDILVILALHSSTLTSACFVLGVCIHYFFLTIVCWTSVIAFDILKKFKYPNQKLRHFVRYVFWVYLIPLFVVSAALTVEFTPHLSDSLFRPRYGQLICGISAPIAKLLFLTVPINLSLIVNIVIFLLAIYKIKKVVNEISHSRISSSVRERCMWYAKLSLLLGISSMFGFFGIQLPCCHSFKFVSFLVNALHGAFIFIAFTCKRSTYRLLSKHILAGSVSVRSTTKVGGPSKLKGGEQNLNLEQGSPRTGEMKDKYRSVGHGHTLGATNTTNTSSEDASPL